jgi:zinc transport system substrate-binding protein
MLITLLTACSKNESGQSDRISIICTTFPHYDWVRQIIGEENMDRFELTLLLDTGVDLHNYQPTVTDIVKVANCDVFIHVGGNSDSWVYDVLRQAVNPDMTVINLMTVLGDIVKHDEYDDHHDGHDHDDDDECDLDHDAHEPHSDEHIWLSLRNAKLICAAIADMLAEIDPDNAQAYRANLDVYTAKLSALDAEYQAAVEAANITALVFADRFPFRYLVDDYGLHHHAAFSGCSAETEASFTTIISLANMVNQLVLNAVMVTESADQSIARTVINNTNAKNQRILVLDSIQSVTSSHARRGVSYLSIMESNLAVLKEALR